MSPSEPAGRSRAARWSLAFRLARREFRRHPWRHALVVLMIAVPVLSAMVAFSAVSTFQSVDGREQTLRAYGSDVRIRFWQALSDDQVDDLRFAVPRGSRLELARSSADWLSTDRDRSDGNGPLLIGTQTTEAPTADAFAQRFRVDTGRPPTGTDEIFLTGPLAELGGWVVGDRIVSGRDERTFTVVGTGVASDDLTTELAVLGDVPDSYWSTVLPGFDYVTLGDPSVPLGPDEWTSSAGLVPDVEAFVWLPDGSASEDVDLSLDNVGFEIIDVRHRSTQGLLGPGMALVFAALSAIVAIVASAAFAIASRRQLRSVGLLASAGADPHTIRAALVLQGAFPGLVAAGLALVVGLTGARIADSRGFVESLTHVEGARTVVSVGGVALAVVLGIVAGTMAAWLPARSASRIPVLSALAGRRPVGPVPNRVPLTGLVFVAAGGVGLALLVRRISSQSDADLLTTITPLLMIATVLAMLFGLIALAPTLVAGVGSLSHRVTGTTRIALRGIARHRSQSAAAVAAVAICLAVPVGVLTAKASLDADDARERSEDAAVSGGGNFQEIDQEPVEPAASVRADPAAMTVRVMGDLTAPEVDALVAQVEAVTGPVTRVPFITFSDGAGGWYPVAAMPPDAARALLAPWAAEQLVAGRAVALLGAPGQAVLDDDVSVVTLEAVAAPDGGPVTLSPGLDADYLVPAAVLDQVAVGRPPLDMLLLHPEPLTTEQADAIARVQGGQDPDRNVETQWPALDQLREARRNAQDAPVDTAEPNSVAVGRSDVWLHVDTPATAESMAEDLQATPMMQPEDREDRAFQRVLRIVALVAGGLSLLVLTITLSLRAVDSVDDHRAAVAAGAAPARIRRQHALEGVVLASLGAVLAIPLGWLPVTAVRFGQVRRRSFSPAGSSIDIVSSRLHVPGWEVVPILVLPIAAVGVLWLVVPLLRTLAQRGPVDQVLPRT